MYLARKLVGIGAASSGGYSPACSTSAHCRHNRINSIGLLIATQTRVPQLAHDAR
jgi:hypothetical protein